jgi:hypothetical protein
VELCRALRDGISKISVKVWDGRDFGEGMELLTWELGGVVCAPRRAHCLARAGRCGLTTWLRLRSYLGC